MDDLDEAIALVYAQPPSGFVAARAALVKQLKADKRKDEAARVAALRRPTKLAWAVGDAVRRAPEPAEAFFAAVDGLAEPGADLRRRTAELRKAVTGLVQAVEGVDPGEATAALLATAADPEAGAALRLGRLAEVPAGGGFGGLTLGSERASSAPARAEPQERRAEAPAAAEDTATGPDDVGREQQQRQEEEARQQARRLDALRAQRDEAAAAEQAAAARAEDARAAFDAARAELERATADLDAARQAASAAAAAFDEAAG